MLTPTLREVRLTKLITIELSKNGRSRRVSMNAAVGAALVDGARVPTIPTSVLPADGDPHRRGGSGPGERSGMPVLEGVA